MRKYVCSVKNIRILTRLVIFMDYEHLIPIIFSPQNYIFISHFDHSFRYFLV